MISAFSTEILFEKSLIFPSHLLQNGDPSRSRSASARRKPEPGSERRKTIGDVRPGSLRIIKF